MGRKTTQVTAILRMRDKKGIKATASKSALEQCKPAVKIVGRRGMRWFNGWRFHKRNMNENKMLMANLQRKASRNALQTTGRVA